MNLFSIRTIYLSARILLLKMLYNFGYSLKKNEKEELLFNFLNRLKPKKIKLKLVRIGSKGDGGYFVPDDFLEYRPVSQLALVVTLILNMI